jgi:Transposase
MARQGCIVVFMSTSNVEEQVSGKDDLWRERLAEQERSGLSVRAFCESQGVSPESFYAWRKRLRKQEPVRFALVDQPARPSAWAEVALELVLANGDRLRISSGVDEGTLRTVLKALRG